MAASDTPRRISEDISVQQVGAETLVYDGRRHLAFCLNASSAAVWKAADGTRTLAQLSDAASEELDARVSKDLVRFAVETLRADGLIEPTEEEETESVATRGISRRLLLQRLGAGSAMLLPAVASIVAPTAAQAYNGCVDCSTSNARAARIRRLQQSGISKQ